MFGCLERCWLHGLGDGHCRGTGRSPRCGLGGSSTFDGRSTRQQLGSVSRLGVTARALPMMSEYYTGEIDGVGQQSSFQPSVTRTRPPLPLRRASGFRMRSYLVSTLFPCACVASLGWSGCWKKHNSEPAIVNSNVMPGVLILCSRWSLSSPAEPDAGCVARILEYMVERRVRESQGGLSHPMARARGTRKCGVEWVGGGVEGNRRGEATHATSVPF